MDKVKGVPEMKHCPATDEQIQDLQDDLIATMPTYTHFKIDQLCAQARSFNEPCTDAKEQGHGCLRAVKAENELAAQKEQFRVLEDDLLVLGDERNAAVAERDKLAEALKSCMNGVQALADQFDSVGIPCEAYHAALKQAHEALKEMK